MGSTPSKDSESLQLADEQASQRSDESPSTTAPACPVAPGRSGPVYNVYSQQIRKPPLVKRDVFKLLSNPLRTHPTNSVLPSASVCPLPESVRGTSLLDLRNNMPLQPNQQPAPGQLKPLSTFRLQSTIPKGGTETTWQYPSPQMFYNGEGRTLRSIAEVCKQAANIRPGLSAFHRCSPEEKEQSRGRDGGRHGVRRGRTQQ